MTERGLARPAEGSNGQPDGDSRFRGLTPFSLLLVLVAAFILYKVQLVIVLVVLAVLFATIIERPVMALHRYRVPRPISILAVYVSIIGTIVLAGILVAPTIADEAESFRTDAPAQLRQLRDDWNESSSPLLNGAGVNALNRLLTEIDDPSSPPQEVTVGIVTGVGGGVIGLLTVFVMAFYYLTEKAFLRRLILNQVRPLSRDRVNRIWGEVEAQVGRWLRGQLLLCLIIGSLSFVGYGLMGVRFWPLLGLWAGITEIIPIVGPWLGGIPAVAIAATQSWDIALMVAIFVVLLQFLENSILVPRVMRGAVGLSPLTVFVAILAGTQYLGILGALLAIPISAAIQVILSEYMKGRREQQTATETVSPGWRWIRNSTAAVPVDPVASNPPKSTSLPPSTSTNQ
ncbi:MAG TPA: AI-2E family transporter [Thermomicrobiales bacterium]|nr:AI-2E family transporter [Thermomicrobiales bacterium]